MLVKALSKPNTGAERQPVSKGSASHADKQPRLPGFFCIQHFWHSFAKHSRGQPCSTVLLTACAQTLQGSLLEDAAACCCPETPRYICASLPVPGRGRSSNEYLNTLKANDWFLGQVCTIVHVIPATDGQSIPFLFQRPMAIIHTMQ